MTRPFPPIAPCPCGKAHAFVQQGLECYWLVCRCGWTSPVRNSERAAILVWNRRDSAGKSWRCFHCNEVFTDPNKAKAHFGEYLGDGEIPYTPICQMPAEEVRQMEKELQRYHEEDTNLHNRIRGLQQERLEICAKLCLVSDAPISAIVREIQSRRGEVLPAAKKGKRR